MPFYKECFLLMDLFRGCHSKKSVILIPLSVTIFHLPWILQCENHPLSYVRVMFLPEHLLGQSCSSCLIGMECPGVSHHAWLLVRVQWLACHCGSIDQSSISAFFVIHDRGFQGKTAAWLRYLLHDYMTWLESSTKGAHMFHTTLGGYLAFMLHTVMSG